MQRYNRDVATPQATLSVCMAIGRSWSRPTRSDWRRVYGLVIAIAKGRYVGTVPLQVIQCLDGGDGDSTGETVPLRVRQFSYREDHAPARETVPLQMRQEEDSSGRPLALSGKVWSRPEAPTRLVPPFRLAFPPN